MTEPLAEELAGYIADIKAGQAQIRQFVADQCNAIQAGVEAQGRAMITEERMQAYVTEAMKPWEMVLDRIGAALDVQGARIEALEQQPHFERPNGGR